MEKNVKKKKYIYIKLNHFSVHLKHCKSTIVQFLKIFEKKTTNHYPHVLKKVLSNQIKS